MTITCCLALKVLLETVKLLCGHNLLVLERSFSISIRLIQHLLLLLPMLLHHNVLHLRELFGCSLLWNKILVWHFHLVKCDGIYFLRSQIYRWWWTGACPYSPDLWLLWDVMLYCDSLFLDSIVHGIDRSFVESTAHKMLPLCAILNWIMIETKFLEVVCANYRALKITLLCVRR